MTCDSTQDYVTVLYQFTFEAFPPQWPMHGLIKQLITICNMHLNMVNDLAEAMKALDGKKNTWHLSCGVPQLDAAMPTPFPLRLLSQQRGCSRCSVPISWRTPLPGIHSSIYLKQGGGVIRLTECLEDSYCSSTIIFPHTRPHISHQPNLKVFAFHSCRGGVEEQRWDDVAPEIVPDI